MEFIKYISSKKALYATPNGFKIKKIIKKPIVLSKDEQSLFNRYKYSAKSRGYDFDLSTDSFRRLIYSNCYFCGIEPKQIHNEILYNGIDRLNNEKGYERENCLACCKVCNRGKGTMNSDEYFDHTVRIMAYLQPSHEAFKKGDLITAKKLIETRLENSGVINFNTIKDEDDN